MSKSQNNMENLLKLVAQCQCVHRTPCILSRFELDAMFEFFGIKHGIDRDTVMLYARIDELDAWVNVDYLKARVIKLVCMMGDDE